MDGESTNRGTYTPPKNIIPPPPKPDSFYRIWSVEHGLWWRANENGYTTLRSQAGLYDRATAIRICNDANRFDKDGKPSECMVPE